VRDADQIAKELNETFNVKDESGLAQLFSHNEHIMDEISSAKHHVLSITKQLRESLFVGLKALGDEQIKILFQNSNFDSFQFAPGINGYALIGLTNTTDMQNILLTPQKEAMLSASLSFIKDLTVNGVERSKLVKEEWRRRPTRIEGDVDEVVDLTGDMDDMQVSNKRLKVERVVSPPPPDVTENAPVRQLFDLWQRGEDVQSFAPDSQVLRQVKGRYSLENQSFVEEELSETVEGEEGMVEEGESGVIIGASEKSSSRCSSDSDEQDEDDEDNENDEGQDDICSQVGGESVSQSGRSAQSDDEEEEDEFQSMPPLIHPQRPKEQSPIITQLTHHEQEILNNPTHISAFLQSDLAGKLAGMLTERHNEPLLEAALTLANVIARTDPANPDVGRFLLQTSGVTVGILKHILPIFYNKEKIRSYANGVLVNLCSQQNYQRTLLNMDIVKRITEV
jgi:hypothetical protein